MLPPGPVHPFNRRSCHRPSLHCAAPSACHAAAPPRPALLLAMPPSKSSCFRSCKAATTIPCHGHSLHYYISKPSPSRATSMKVMVESDSNVVLALISNKEGGPWHLRKTFNKLKMPESHFSDIC